MELTTEPLDYLLFAIRTDVVYFRISIQTESTKIIEHTHDSMFVAVT